MNLQTQRGRVELLTNDDGGVVGYRRRNGTIGYFVLPVYEDGVVVGLEAAGEPIDVASLIPEEPAP